MRCPYCNKSNPLHETIDGETDFEDEDISICIGCGEFGEFKGNKIMKLDIENLDIEAKQEVDDMRVAWLRTKAKLNAQKSEHHQG